VLGIELGSSTRSPSALTAHCSWRVSSSFSFQMSFVDVRIDLINAKVRNENTRCALCYFTARKLVQTKIVTWPAYDRDKVACYLGSFLKIILGGVPHSVREDARGQLCAVVSLPTTVRVLGPSGCQPIQQAPLPAEPSL